MAGGSSSNRPPSGTSRARGTGGEREGVDLNEELELVRRAYEALQRQVIRERVLLAEQAQELRDEVACLAAEKADIVERLAWREDIGARQAEELEWRTEVMRSQEAQLARTRSSLAYRLCARLRAATGALRRRR